jgi:hypothetical protein
LVKITKKTNFTKLEFQIPQLLIDSLQQSFQEICSQAEDQEQHEEFVYPPSHPIFIFNMLLGKWSAEEMKIISRIIFYFILDITHLLDMSDLTAPQYENFKYLIFSRFFQIFVFLSIGRLCGATSVQCSNYRLRNKMKFCIYGMWIMGSLKRRFCFFAMEMEFTIRGICHGQMPAFCCPAKAAKTLSYTFCDIFASPRLESKIHRNHGNR